MASVYLRFVSPDRPLGERNAIERLARLMSNLAERCIEHRLVPDPAEAELILLDASFTLSFSHADRSRTCLRRHPLRLQYPDKVFVFDPDDDPSPFLPGIFASLDCRYWNPAIQQAGPYLHDLENELLEWRNPLGEAKYLFSFVGAPSTHRVRHAVVRVESPRGYIIQTNARWPRGDRDRATFKQQYADAIHNSKFILCPRGRGTSSARLFDSMRAGRVPVVISDHWVAPRGPAWETCSVRIAEKDIHQIPSLLTQLEPAADAMGGAAREAFETWFSRGRVFGRIVDWCLQLKEKKNPKQRSHGVRIARFLCRPVAVKRFVVSPIVDYFRRE
jgi:hypothetical protein